KCVEGEPMRLAERYCGFTLTEVLMAVGILGVGLTMVASIFPVAVDQSRRSQDQTSAALCARSVAAMLRVRSTRVLTTLRDKKEVIREDVLLPRDLLVYRPSWFLYRSDKPRLYEGVSTKALQLPELWSGGNYVARTFTCRTSTSGPHRLTLAICRSGGQPPARNLEPWNWYVQRFGVRPGMYVFHVYRKTQSMGYLVEHVASDKKGYLTVGQAYDATPTGTTIIAATTSDWQVVPDAVAIYHSYLGE
ncbi:MAG: type II secretion system protein, partial [Phycisphaerae bacterium]